MVFFANNPKLYANPDYDQELFANMPRTLLTLFQLMTMDDWANMMRPVGNTMPFSWLYTMPFVFLGICLMNLVLAIFTDELINQTRRVSERKKKKFEEERERKVALCNDAINEFDENKDGMLDEDEMSTILSTIEEDEEMKNLFEEIGVPTQSLKDMMRIAEQDDEGQINVKELLRMVETTQEPTKKSDVFELRFRIFEFEKRAVGAVNELMTKLDGLQAQMAQSVKGENHFFI